VALAAALAAACLVSACSSPAPGSRAPGTTGGTAPAAGPPGAVSPETGLPLPDAGITFPLHTRGARIVDARGKPVKLAMVNWYGAESPDFVVGGLAYQPIRTIVRMIVSLGFNGVRLPWSNQMWERNPVVRAGLVAANPQLAGERARTIFGQVVRDLAEAGLMIVLDNHNSDAEWCCSATDGNALWYNRRYPQSAWLSDWRSVAAQFAGLPQVIGADLRNEPRGWATWGGGNPGVDWRAAAQSGGNAVQGTDPRLLIFVEGTHSATDLSGVAALPVRLRIPGRVVYEAHDYAPEQSRATSYDAWMARIRAHWGYLAGTYPLWIGEFGTCNVSDACVASGSGAYRGLWFRTIVRYLRYHDVNWAYWALNGTTSDGLAGQHRAYGQREGFGVLNTRWDGPSRQSLLASLRAIQAPCPAPPLADGTYDIVNGGTGDAIAVPGAGTANGAGLMRERPNGAAGQHWRVTSLGCGLYTITSTADGMSMDVLGQSARAGARVVQWAYWGGGNQQFVVTREPDGYYTFASINSMEPVGVARSAGSVGGRLAQVGTGGGRDQRWSFRRAR
jgi:endoglucanase